MALVVIAGVWFLSRGDGGQTATPNAPAATSAAAPGASTPPSPAAKPSTPAKPSSQAKPSSPAKPSGSATESAEPVPAPSPGRPTTVGTGKTEPVEPVKTKEPVALDDTGDFGTGLTVKLRDIDSVKGQATVPGEIAGPALKINLVAENDSKAAVSLDQVVVFVSYGQDRTPAVELSKGAKRLSGKLAAGDSKTGAYIYTVPTDERKLVRIEISYSGKAPTVAFQGAV